MTDSKSLLKELCQSTDFWGTCPRCGCKFALAEAQLFALDSELPAAAVDRIAGLRTALKERKAELNAARRRMTETAAATAEAVHIGKVCERIAPSLEGFRIGTRDVRPLWEPIDFIGFHGLSSKGQVEMISFIEVKTGAARLTPVQKAIHAVVERGAVRLDILPELKGGL